jgi:WD40 repeat protein
MLEINTRALVRIFSQDNIPVGAGMYMPGNKVLTCAHVIEQALAINDGSSPNSIVRLDFPLSDSREFFEAIVEFWGPSSDSNEKQDIALLKLLSDKLSEDIKATPVSLKDEDLWGHTLRVFGFPSGYESGVWASGVCRGSQADGFIQIEDTKQTGYSIQPGFSGAPVWDEQKSAMIGIIVAAESNTLIKAAYIIPFTKIKKYVDFESIIELGQLINVHQLPPHYLYRQSSIEKTINKILGTQENSKIDQFSHQMTILHGMGGVGKTVVASAVARNENIRCNFIDGIIWVTFGQQADIAQKLLYIGQCLGDNPGKYSTYSSAKISATQLLSEKRILLILDDVWDIAHVDVFSDVIGLECKLLVTTRDARLATLFGANDIGLDVLRSDSAIELLSNWANIPTDQLPDHAESIVDECGNLPFAISLCGAMIRDGFLWTDLLDALREADLSFIEAQFPNYPYTNILRALKVSLDTLDESTLEHYNSLAVFHEDVNIPEETVLLLWLHLNSTSNRHGRKMLSEFDRKALLRLEGEHPNRYIRIHDLNHDYLLTVLGTLTGLHVEILAAYKAKCPDGWYSGPDDGYFWDYLAYHLLQAGRGNELVSVVKDFRYIARKTYLRNSLAVETDLQLAQQYNPDDKTLEVIRHQVVGSIGYLLDLGETLNDVAVTLFEKLKNNKKLQNRLSALENFIVRPHFQSLHELPDITHPGLIRTITPHTTYIWRCAISSDGTKVASASSDGTIKISAIDGGAILNTLKGHAATVRDCKFTKDNHTIISASDDKTLIVWDVKSGRNINALLGHSDKVNACAIANYDIVVSASDDKTLKIWNYKSGKFLGELLGHDDSVNDCSIDPTCNLVTSASADCTLKIWELHTSKLLHTLIGHNSPVTGCAFSPDGKIILSSSQNGFLIIWDVETGRLVKKWKAHHQPISACRFNKQGNMIVSSAGRQNVVGDAVTGQIDISDHTIRLWDIETQSELQCFHGHTRRVTDCQISTGGNFIVSASRDGTIKIWDTLNRDVVIPQDGHKDWSHSCKVSMDGKTVVTASDDSTVRIWNPSTGKTDSVLQGHQADVNDCAITKDKRYIISASRDCTAKIWNVDSQKEMLTFADHKEPLSACALSPDDRFVATGANDNIVKIWTLADGILVKNLLGHSDKIGGCVYSNDGNTIVSCSDDLTLKIWDVNTGEARLTLSGHTKPVCRCAISADDSFVVSASADATLKVWNAKTGFLRMTLSGHRDQVRGCTILPDQQHVLSASLDRSLKLWDLQTGNCLASIYLNDQLLNCAMFPDNNKAVAVGAVGTYFFQINW